MLVADALVLELADLFLEAARSLCELRGIDHGVGTTLCSSHC
jgi:hypothetical protein